MHAVARSVRLAIAVVGAATLVVGTAWATTVISWATTWALMPAAACSGRSSCRRTSATPPTPLTRSPRP